MADIANQPIRIRITNIPPDTSAAAAAVRMSELVPGLVFDGLHGTFKRPHYSIAFDVNPEGGSADVVLDHGDGFTVVKRIITKTGWMAMDPVRNLPIDLDSSSRHGTAMLAIPTKEKKPLTEADLYVEEEPPPPLPLQQAPPKRRRELPPRIRHAVLGVVGVAAIVLAWQWTRHAPTLRLPEPDRASQNVDASAADAPATPGASGAETGPPSTSATPSSPNRPAARSYGSQYLNGALELVHLRSSEDNWLAPEFRGNPVVHQLVEYRAALNKFSTTTGERRVLPPDRLADPALFPKFWPNGLLPAGFVEPVRNRYLFQASGKDCTHHGENLREIEGLCEWIVYTARPPGSASRLPSFAFFTEDDRIHYRADGRAPTRDDPTVDNGAPPDGGNAAAPSSSIVGGVTGHLTRALETAASAAGIHALERASVARRETDIIKDFRTLYSAEITFTQAEIGYFAAPEKLADAGNYKTTGWRPLLPRYFAEAVRDGYTFQFVGEEPAPAQDGTLRLFAPVYRSFVYAALPVDPGPAERRSLAIFADGMMYATTERRVPTRKDSPLQ